MELTTKHFGTVNIDESKVVTFENGIFGFEGEKQFVFLFDDNDSPSPFVWMQSVTDKDICLPMVDPMIWYNDYAPEIEDAIISDLGELNEDILEIYTTVVIPEDITSMTTNLKAPIIINKDTKKGAQAIACDDAYGVRHNLYNQIKQIKEEGE